MWFDVIIFQIIGVATTLTPPAIAGKNNLFSGSRNITALGKTADAE
jgi:hypothetical protein